jgi:hypothetical protein
VFAFTMIRKFCFFVFLLCSLSIQVFSQQVVFVAEATANKIGLEDQVQVSFTIENATQLKGFQEPSFPGFQIVGGPYQSQSTNISFNGSQRVRTMRISLTYVLQPTKLGSITLPPMIAQNADGSTFKSNSITIQVEKGSLVAKQQRSRQQQIDPFDAFDDPFFGGGGDPFAAMRQQQAQMQQLLQQMMQAANGGSNTMQQIPEIDEKDLEKNIFVKVNVDKSKVKVGEQVTAVYKMYSRLPMQAQLSKLPSLNGFWNQDFDLPAQQEPKQEVLDGVTYQTFVLKKSALFPQQTGRLVLDAAEVKGIARIANRNNPYGKEVQFTIKSAPVIINVEALPTSNQPKDFGGAVGQYTFSAKLDTNQITTDQSVNLVLTIKGTGNIKLIQPPVLVLPNGLTAYEPIIKDTITSRSLTISGEKVFTYTIAPSVAGKYDIAPLEFSYFNSKDNNYTTLKSSPFKIEVTQGASLKSTKDALMIKELADIDKSKNLIYKKPFFVVLSQLYWIILFLPWLIYLGYQFYQKKSQSQKENLQLYKNKKANKIALKRLKQAKNHLDKRETIPFYDEISKAIWLYLSDKLHIPLADLSKESALEALQQRSLDDELLNKLNEIFDVCAMALYAPSQSGNQMNQIYDDAIQLIGSLENKLKK